MYELGQAVAVLQAGERQLGTVVRVAGAAGTVVYDVSLEEVVLKCVDAASLKQAADAELAELLQELTTLAPNAREGGELAPTAGMRRDRYLEELAQALDRARAHARDAQAAESDSGVCATPSRFPVGCAVVAHRDGAWLWAQVLEQRVHEDGVLFGVGGAGERWLARATEIALPEEATQVPTPDGFALGARVRFVASGYEDDEQFVGTLCSVREDAEGVELGILFDDGDVLEGLVPCDLARA